MNNLDSKLSTKRFLSARLIGRLAPYGVSLIVGVTVVVPFFLWQYEWVSGTRIALRLLNTHDLATIVAIMEQFAKGLQSGVLYPRWLPDINFGYGVATMVFYPPGLFYLSSLINAVTGDWTITVFVIAAASSVVSGLTMYRLSKVFYGKLASAIAALLYLLLPYRSLDLYWRGALPEFVGFALLPVVLYFSYMLGSKGRLGHYAGLGLFYGLFLMTHLPVGYLLTYTLGLYAVVWAFRSRDLAIALRVAGGMALGLLMSSVYWLPAAIETRHASDVVTGSFPYEGSFITLLPGSNVFDNLVNSVFAFQALALLVALLLFRMIPHNAESRSQEYGATVEGSRPRLWWGPSSGKDFEVLRSTASQSGLWIIMALAATFMSTSFSIYVSKLIPKIQIAVPAWRWLAISSVFICLLVGATADRLIGRVGVNGLKLWGSRAALAAAIVMNLWLTVGSVIPRSLSNGNYVRPDSFVTTGFIPKQATYPDNLPSTPNAAIEPEGGVIETTRWDPQDREVQMNAEQSTMLRLRTYNFPGWTARIDGNVVPMLSDKDGVQQVEVPAGIHVVRATFENTPPRTVGTLLSGVGVLLILGLSLAGRVRQPRFQSEERLENDARERESASRMASIAKRSAGIPFKALGLIGIVVIIGGAIVVMTTGRSGSRNARSQTGGSTDKPVIAGSLATGSETHLYLSGQDSVLVAVDERALDQVMNALAGRDSAAVEALVDSGRALRVPNNTRVRVLEIGAGKTKVRILEGEHVMVDVWVPERWLR